MLVLHHMAESLCSQRVRLVLAEKGLAWSSALVAPPTLRDPTYLALNPAGVVPTLEHDGQVFGESRVICEYLDDAFPLAPMRPARPRERYLARRWSKACDDGLYLALFVLTFMAWMRPRYLAMPPETGAAALPGLADPVKRRISQDLLEEGWRSEALATALRHVLHTVEGLDEALQASRWLAGDGYSAADSDLLAALQRLHDLGLACVWDEHAGVAGWFDRARSRPAFTVAVEAWRDEAVADRYGQLAEAASEPFAGLLVTARDPAGSAGRIESIRTGDL